MQGYRVRIRGVVQGVGFRPMIWHVANSLALNGSVLNDGEGVVVELWCSPDNVATFLEQIQLNCPALAAINSIETTPFPDFDTLGQDIGFHIVASDETSTLNAGIPVDAAVCRDCIDETFDPKSRRYRYPFTNCTHCGPRLSIIKSLPYDRPKTSMANFPLCAECEQEYLNPADRRFHAQPVACPACGPKVWLCDKYGEPINADNEGGSDAIQLAASLLKQGKILAVKGIGGFHLVCDATNEETVKKLRQRKFRPAKPFAVMMQDCDHVNRYCDVTPESIKALQSHAAPIVILPIRAVTTSLIDIATSVMPDLNEIGVMLPATPLHVLLMTDVGVPLVMTSANLSGNPQCIDNDEALADLQHIADVWLMHDREIVSRTDDSVLRQTSLGTQLLRRSRGYAPSPISLPVGFEETENIMGLGGEVKNAFCLLSRHGAILSQYIGDLESVRIWQDFRSTLGHFQTLYRFEPYRVAVDKHPEYLSTKYGNANYSKDRVFEVQHHHAHITACMGDNQLPRNSKPVLGVVFDGLGLGDDGGLWGGEFLLADYTSFQRLAHLSQVALPGGMVAIKQPWRNLLAWRHKLNLTEDVWQQLIAKHDIASKTFAIDQMIEKAINTPVTTSAGRLFDAVAASLSICFQSQSYEGQAAIELESLAHSSNEDSGYTFDIVAGEPAHLDPSPMWIELGKDLASGTAPNDIARRFHLGLALGIADMVDHLSKQMTYVPDIVLTGGVFQNRLLLEYTHSYLTKRGFSVLRHQQVPANDGGLAFGQALVVSAQSLARNIQT
ncbi:carbamoyltransferase HypF [Enterovibrio gelatinilyticus]|nr:carbamoyltransferase HypF [Enterovibrio sp. ZSDZ42]